MATKAKSNSIITARPDSEAGIITFTVLGVGDIVLDINKAHADLIHRAMLHGFTQRVSDAAAIPRNTETGLSATPQDKYNAMAALVDHYNSGSPEWSRARTAGGARVDGDTQLGIAAIAEFQGVEVADMRERIKNIAAGRELSVKDYVAAVVASARKGGKLAPVAAAFDRLKAAQPVRTDLDANDLVADLESDGE